MQILAQELADVVSAQRTEFLASIFHTALNNAQKCFRQGYLVPNLTFSFVFGQTLAVGACPLLVLTTSKVHDGTNLRCRSGPGADIFRDVLAKENVHREGEPFELEPGCS
jgi:hypothetical protein